MLLAKLLYELLVRKLGSMAQFGNTNDILRLYECERYSLQQPHTIFSYGLGHVCQRLVKVGLEVSAIIRMGEPEKTVLMELIRPLDLPDIKVIVSS